MPEETLTIETHHAGEWWVAGTVTLHDADRGVAGASTFDYDTQYFCDHAAQENLKGRVIDRRAVSVRTHVNMDGRRAPTWPPWLLDLVPQGVARARIAADLQINPDDSRIEVHLLRRAGGAPIGNVRVKEAWDAEQVRIKDIACPPLDDTDIATRSTQFLDVMDSFAHLASGSSGVQGAWPKALLTRARDGAWYPDPFVETQAGIEHAIVKMLASKDENAALILRSEAPYLQVAREFGLNVANPLRYAEGVLFIPRFDRTVTGKQVLLHGQESLVSALGEARFGHIEKHETYLKVIRDVSDDPVADTLEYVLRDLLGVAMGDNDNHGRNTALAKNAAGGVRLAPLFDFAPMRISTEAIGESTKWRCLQDRGVDRDWSAICAAAAFDQLPATRIQAALVERLDLLRRLPAIARDLGVPPIVVDRAFNVNRIIRNIEAMKELPCPSYEP